MRNVFALTALLSSSLVPIACGGPPVQTREVAVLPSASVSASAAPAVDLSAVPMPDSVIAVFHATHITASADMVSEWAKQPLEVDKPLSELLGERIAKIVDLDSPADMVFTATDRGGRKEPDMRFGLALTVKNFDAAKSALQAEYGLLPISNGAFEITRSGTHRREGDSDFRSCALAPSDNGGRVVCSHDPTTRDAVLPYLTRGVKGMLAYKSDLHIEARLGMFREMARRERTSVLQSGTRFLGGGSELRAMWEAGVGDMLDSALDADHATLEANIDAKQSSVEVKIVGRASNGLVTKIFTAHPERAEPVPAAFLRLPGDADIAFFLHGLDADQIAAPKQVVMTSLDGAIKDDNKIKDADRKAFIDVTGHTIDLLATPLVYAHGVDFAKALPAVTGLTEASDGAKIRAGVEAAAGWEVFGMDAAPDKLTALFKEWTALIARPLIAATLKSDHTPTWKVVGAPHGAPPGTVQVAFTQPHDDVQYPGGGGKPTKHPPLVLTLHTLIVPDGATHVWIVNALDEATALAKAKQMIAGGTAGTLATREGLDALRASRINAGGFVTPRGVGLGLPVTWLMNWDLRSRAANDPLLGISNQTQYTTPVTFTYAEANVGGQPALTFGMRVPRAALDDALKVGPRLFH